MYACLMLIDNRFNHAGTLLATGSKEPVVVIWTVDHAQHRLRKKDALEGHASGACCLAWSPDDRHLAIVGGDECSEILIWDVDRWTLVRKMCHSQDDSLTCVSWFPDGQHFVAGGIKGQFYKCDLEGTVLSSWEGIRVRGLHCLRDGRATLAADAHNRLREYVFATSHDRTLIRESYQLVGFCVDDSETYALLVLKDQGLHLYDLRSRSLVRRYRGLEVSKYTIGACFGGLDQAFLASGSEDNNVYVWHRDSERPVAVLTGHSGVVNAVAWNPRLHSLLVSGSDDGTLRVWGPASVSPDPGLEGGIDSCEVTSTTSGQSSSRSGDW